MRIRRGQLKDANQILRMLKDTSELQGMSNGMEEPLYSKEYVKDYITNRQMNLVLVAEENDKIIGFILAEMWMKKKFSYLADMLIVKEARGKGVGRKLYCFYEQYCKKNGLKNIAALVQTKNKGMHEFCKKIGLIRGERLYQYEKEI